MVSRARNEGRRVTLRFLNTQALIVRKMGFYNYSDTCQEFCVEVPSSENSGTQLNIIAQ